MRYFALVDFQYAVLSYILGLVAVILIYMAWGSYPAHRKPTSTEEIKDKEGHEVETGHDAETNPVAPFLIFVYIGTALWSIAYMVYIGLMRAVSF